MSLKLLKSLLAVAVVLALVVVMLGAYTRLTDAGLGCPDWPGCYGHMVLPSAQAEKHIAQSQYPKLPIETRKAWTEMIHRYAAGTLAVLIFAMSMGVLRSQWRKPRLPWRLPLVLCLLVVFQAALGMWTVTLKLLPIVVLLHLLGGIFIFASICYYWMQLSVDVKKSLPQWRHWITLGAVFVFCQIALGGWVSSNYAGIACIGFPRCNGMWLPSLHFSQGFHLFSAVGANYQGGVLDNEIRVTIQFIHRLGACVVAGYLLILSGFLLWRTERQALHKMAGIVIILVFAQFALGVVNVVYLLPLWVAVAHNGIAALLFACVLSMRYLATGGAHVHRC